MKSVNNSYSENKKASLLWTPIDFAVSFFMPATGWFNPKGAFTKIQNDGATITYFNTSPFYEYKKMNNVRPWATLSGFVLGYLFFAMPGMLFQYIREKAQR
ncbi:MAG: hypothetical protein FWC61_03600 [Proteobacteria bacterium]|nr:hypothetical protein [Pseudomonadota bacterium]